jgi:predicted deacylase
MPDSASSAAIEFEVELQKPDIEPWIEGNTGVLGFTGVQGDAPGPHVVLLSLTHGNEFSGAIVLRDLLAAGIRPKRGRLTIGFVNLEAFARFDPQRPTVARFIDEDLNRVWDTETLDGPRQSRELNRAREIRPIIDTADILLDLHSMLWPADPCLLCGETLQGQELAKTIGVPELIVADRGHANGRRIIDYQRFTAPGSKATANLLEAGQHWALRTADICGQAVRSLLRHVGLADFETAPATAPQRLAVVTKTITAATKQFGFIEPYRGGNIIQQRNTLIAMDGSTEVRTPHDDCLLVMPSLRPGKGHTAVRLARFVPFGTVPA